MNRHMKALLAISLLVNAGFVSAVSVIAASAVTVHDAGPLDSSCTNDGVHLNGRGYLRWKNALEKYVSP